MIDLMTPQRQSPLAIVFLGLRILRSLGLSSLVILLLFVFQAPLDGALVVLPFIVILGLGALSALAWWRYTFVLVGDELVVTKGVLRVDRLTVPLDRIQSMAIDQELLHRITGLVKISVDTAGSSEAEFTIDAVSRPVAEELERQAVTTRQHVQLASQDLPTTPMPEDDWVVFTQGPERLLRAALTTWPLSGLVVLGPLVAFGDDFGERVPESFPEIDTTALPWWGIPIGIVGFVGFSMVLNIIRVFLQDWDLTLHSSATSLRRTSGLLSRTSKASSVARIQVVTSTQNPLQRSAGLRSVNLSTIGEGDLALLGCDDEQWQTVLRLAQPDQSDDAGVQREISPASAWLITRNTIVAATVIAVAGFFLVGWWSLLVLLIIAPTWWLASVHVRNFRWGFGSRLSTSSRVINRATQLTLPRKTNAVIVRQSIFERRRGLASVIVSTAAGAISIGMIPLVEAAALRDAVLQQVETDHRPWM